MSRNNGMYGFGDKSKDEVNDRVKNGEEDISNQRRIKTTMPIDRLSALPDEILIHILSLVDDDMKHAAVTCVLSKRWQFLWSEIPRLNFCDDDWNPEKMPSFVSWVHRTIIFRSRSYLERFRVRFLYNKCYALDVNAWVRFAVKHKAKYLSVDLNTRNHLYTPPQVLYSYPTLTELTLKKCILAPQRKIEWPGLTRLVVRGVELPQDIIEIILSSCPVLYELELRLCWGFNNIHSESLRNITVSRSADNNNADLLEIWAPCLRYLGVVFSPIETRLQLTNVPSSLESAQIMYTGIEETVEAMNVTMELLEKTRHAKELVLGGPFVEVLSEMVTHGWQLPQSSRQSLSLETLRHEKVILGLLCLLETSPNLEKLRIECDDPYEKPARTWDPAGRNDLDCNLLNLKSVHLLQFADPKLDGEPLLTISRILLKRATTLKKLVIKQEDFTEFPSNFTEMSQAILNYPITSEKAVVVFEQLTDENR